MNRSHDLFICDSFVANNLQFQLSGRQGVDLSCAGRRRAVAFTPIPVNTSRRAFHLTLPAFGSSELPAVANEGNKNDTAPSSPPVRLSPAEQRIREALLARKLQVEQENAQRELAEKEREAQLAQTARTRRNAYRPLRPGLTISRGVTPRDNLEDERLQPARFLQHNTVYIPRNLRMLDWTCPECQSRCYGKHARCSACNTIRPELVAIGERERANRSGRPDRAGLLHTSLNVRKMDWKCGRCHHSCLESENACPNCGTRRPGRHSSSPRQADSSSEQSFKIRNLSRSILSDLNEPQRAKREASVEERSSRQAESSTGDRNGHIPQTEPEKGETRTEPQRGQTQTEPQKGLTVKPTWSWDMTSLDRMEIRDGDAPEEKPSKRRDDRKQRESQFDEEEFEDDEELRQRREERKRLKKEKARQKELKKSEPSPLYLPEFISVSNLADVIGVRPALFVQRMGEMGFEDVTYSHVLDAETAGLVATEFNFEPIFDTAVDDLTAAPEPKDKSLLPPRPPVVTIMGHVDHGKTTILDWLRKSSVAASEHGGITQHIGAFSVSMPSGKTITFLDTPGHSAFLEMRRRGADVTDIVVLVVAADDSVKPQTIEAIKHATEAKVPVIVAISKIDKENVNPERVKQDLAVRGVNVEDYGGDVQAICVSGKTGQGMLELEEAIIALSEMLDHRADDKGNVEGWVIEATTKSHGRVVTALVRRGTLRPGDIIVAGSTWARVRTLRNEAGVVIDKATPGMPVEIDGWREQPLAGSEILQAPNEQRAKEVVELRLERTETEKLNEDMTAINQARRELVQKRRLEELEGDEQLKKEEEPTGPKPIHFIIKADVSGSAEAVLNSITAIGNNEVYANILRSGVGPVGEFDIEHAATANGHVISFNMPIDPAILRMAELQGVKIMDHNIIYKLMDNVKATLSEHLAPSVTHRVTGEAEISQIFEISVKGRVKTSIAGCKVRNGIINRTKNVRVLRGQDIIYDGEWSCFTMHCFSPSPLLFISNFQTFNLILSNLQAPSLPSRTSKRT